MKKGEKIECIRPSDMSTIYSVEKAYSPSACVREDTKSAE